ncbi:MAG: cobalamin-dependent protein [Actinobacteria bacterium]|nr:cobalamin-dependent protein [Actinomycetota bacterium]
MSKDSRLTNDKDNTRSGNLGGLLDKKNDNPADLTNLVANLRETETLQLVEQRLTMGDNPLIIVEECQEGMRQVGEYFEKGKYYLSGLIMAGEIFREVMELTQPVIKTRITGKDSGKILLGTVAGDIHDIGKNIQSMLLSCYGFTVLDLGVDVPPYKFLDHIINNKPDIVGLSGLLTSSFEAMRETVITIRQVKNKITEKLPIIIGGGLLNEQVLQYTGADYFITNAMKGVRLCQRLRKASNN